jgi:hypothetical protein
VKYGSAEKCRRKCRGKFCGDRVPSRQTIHNLVNKFRTTELLLDKKKKNISVECLLRRSDLCDFFFWGCLKEKIYISNPRTEGLKENIPREISNIPA